MKTSMFLLSVLLGMYSTCAFQSPMWRSKVSNKKLSAEYNDL